MNDNRTSNDPCVVRFNTGMKQLNWGASNVKDILVIARDEAKHCIKDYLRSETTESKEMCALFEDYSKAIKIIIDALDETRYDLLYYQSLIEHEEVRP